MAEPLKKEQILDTAEQVLRRYGLEKTSVVDVARALGVSHGTLYRHFPSKSALREAVGERWLHRVSSPLAKIIHEDCSSIDKLRKWFDNLIDTKRSKAIEDPELFAMYNALAEESVEGITAHINELIQQLSEIVEEGIENGEFKRGEEGEIAEAFFMEQRVFTILHLQKSGSHQTSIMNLSLFGTCCFLD